MSLREIFCQDRPISILQKAYQSNKTAHAYIFAGPQGIGKFKTAREWAKLLLCKNPVTKTSPDFFADSCGLCQSCRLFEAGSHSDYNPVYKELIQFTKNGKGKLTPVEMPIDVIREFLIEKIVTKPALSRKKIFIVSEAEKLNAASQNSLLKSLEEPPEYCCIILLCTQLEKLLPTTRSRCQTIRFMPVDEERIVNKLNEAGLDEERSLYFARLCQGSLGQACQWAQFEPEDVDLYKIKKELLNSMARYDFSDSLSLAQKFLKESKNLASAWAKNDTATSKTDINRRAAKTLIRIVISALQDAINLKVTPQRPLINFDQKERIETLANRLELEQVTKKITKACEAMHQIDSSVNEKLVFEQLLLNLAVSDTIKV